MTAVPFTYAFLATFIAGTFVLQWWQQPDYPLPLWICCLAAASFGTMTGILRRSRAGGITACIAAGMIIALWAVANAADVPGPASVERFLTGRSMTLHGFVANRPDLRSDRILYEVDVTEIIDDDVQRMANGRVLVTDYARWPRLTYGQEARVQGVLEQPTEEWYAEYLRLSDIHTVLRSSAVTPLDERRMSITLDTLYRLRDAFERRIDLVYTEPASSLLAGLLTGSRRGIPDDLTEAFRRTGLTHIIAISGTNVTIVIAVISSLFFFLPLKRRLFPSIVAIVLFTLFVGASASVVRASIMGVLGLIALRTGRLVHARLSILWTCFFMLLWNPLLLWYDAGFQLSFLAVIGLTELRPLLEKPLKAVPSAFGVKDALLATIAAQLTAVPWGIYRFGLLSIISPLANILVVPLVPLAMFFGFTATAAGFMSVTLGRIAGFPGLGILDLIVTIARILGSIDAAAVDMPGWGLRITVVYYIALSATIVFMRRRLKAPWPQLLGTPDR